MSSRASAPPWRAGPRSRILAAFRQLLSSEAFRKFPDVRAAAAALSAREMLLPLLYDRATTVAAYRSSNNIAINRLACNMGSTHYRG